MIETLLKYVAEMQEFETPFAKQYFRYYSQVIINIFSVNFVFFLSKETFNLSFPLKSGEFYKFEELEQFDDAQYDPELIGCQFRITFGMDMIYYNTFFNEPIKIYVSKVFVFVSKMYPFLENQLWAQISGQNSAVKDIVYENSLWKYEEL